MTPQEELLLALGYCLFMLILFLVFQRFQPRNINSFYGYRTTRSMKSEHSWKAANAYSMKLSIKLCLYSFVFPFVLYFVYPEYNMLLTVIANTLLLISVIWFTESYLKRHFDAQGNPK